MFLVCEPVHKDSKDFFLSLRVIPENRGRVFLYDYVYLTLPVFSGGVFCYVLSQCPNGIQSFNDLSEKIHGYYEKFCCFK